MIDQIARHGMMDIKVEAKGDLHIDAHHTVEDIGITLGLAFAQALGDKKGISRYGHAYVPLDESLSRVVIDFSGRPSLYYDVTFNRAFIGNFDVDLLREFFQGFVNHAGVTLHIDNLKAGNAHHIAETVFKAFGRAVRNAIAFDERPNKCLKVALYWPLLSQHQLNSNHRAPAYNHASHLHREKPLDQRLKWYLHRT